MVKNRPSRGGRTSVGRRGEQQDQQDRGRHPQQPEANKLAHGHSLTLPGGATRLPVSGQVALRGLPSV